MRNNLFRFLLMFGPMIYNRVSRFLENRKRQQSETARPSIQEERSEEAKPQEEKPSYGDEELV